ncbi:MAG TPA: hypothetical protein VN958_13520, partial [Chitinophagaceae bacterium]|nr:hypothetical protein [Chitinophagaceae bacterium]
MKRLIHARNLTYLFIILNLILSCNKSDGKLEGVVTYYFNSNYGDKPDVGTNIIICNKKDLRKGIIDSLRLFMSSKFSVNQINFYEDLIKEYNQYKFGDYKTQVETFKKIINQSKDRLNKLNISLEQFDKIKEQITDFKLQFSIKKTHEVICDGNGRYEASLPSGNYCVLAQSNHRNNFKTGEILGVLEMEEIGIQPSK